jgi:GNAT superfamily N-acetyltransferase
VTDGLHVLSGGDALAALPHGSVPALDAGAWTLMRPEWHAVVVDGGALVGRASAWVSDPPPVAADPAAHAGRIGHAAWLDASVGARLIGAAERWMRERGADLALGPLDGSTWFTYRVVTDQAPGGGTPEPPFILEPDPPAAVAAAFEMAGYAPIAHYLSSRVDRLADLAAALADGLRQWAERGVRVRPFDTAQGEAELRALHPLLLRAFAGNPYFVPLDEGQFLAGYGALLPVADPRLILIAEREGRPVGVVLALPDGAQAARGETVDTVVVKTLAVDPDERGRGLGAFLVLAVQERARQAGFGRALHALMHTDNASARISRHLGRPMRRYALLARPLS